MNKYIILAFVCLLFCFTNAANAELSVEIDTGLYSHFVGGNNSTLVYNDALVQGSAKIVYTLDRLGIYGLVWGSCPKEWNENFGSEIDFVGGIFTDWKNFYFDLSLARYDLYKVADSRGDLSAIVFKTKFPTVNKITPYLNIEGIIPDDKDILEGGMVYRAGAGYSLPEIFGKLINLDLSVAGHDGAVGRRPEPVSSVKVSISTDFTLWGLTITPTLNTQKRLGYEPENGGMTEDKIWASINIKYVHIFK